MSNQLTVQQLTTELMPALQSNGIELLLPKHVSIETFTRLAAIAIVSNPSLEKADQQSVIQSLILAAKDGLVCDNREAALVPFNTKVNNQWVNKAQYMPMVDGVLKRVRQSGQVKLIASKPVFSNDEFTFWTDEDGDHFKHVPHMGPESGDLIAVVAYAIMNDGSKHIELLRRWEIDRVKNASKTGNKEGSPWIKWFDRMACKTGLHRVARRLPNSSEVLEMLERGDMMDFKQSERDVTPESEPDALDALLGKSESQQAEEASVFDQLMHEMTNAVDLNAIAEVNKKIIDAGDGVTEEQKSNLREAFKTSKQRIISASTDY